MKGMAKKTTKKTRFCLLCSSCTFLVFVYYNVVVRPFNSGSFNSGSLQILRYFQYLSYQLLIGGKFGKTFQLNLIV